MLSCPAEESIYGLVFFIWELRPRKERCLIYVTCELSSINFNFNIFLSFFSESLYFHRSALVWVRASKDFHKSNRSDEASKRCKPKSSWEILISRNLVDFISFLIRVLLNFSKIGRLRRSRMIFITPARITLARRWISWSPFWTSTFRLEPLLIQVDSPATSRLALHNTSPNTTEETISLPHVVWIYPTKAHGT